VRIKRGDLKPDLTIDVSALAGVTVDLSAAAVIVNGVRGGLLAISRSATGSAQGLVTMPWEPTDTAVAGWIGFEVSTVVGGKERSYPDSGLVWVEVVEDTDDVPPLPPGSVLAEDPNNPAVYIVYGG
jgi:hypothetical protein